MLASTPPTWHRYYLLLFALLLSNGYHSHVVNAAPLCPCPEKWMPPFRASQLIYSEFPEDKGRSLYNNEIERKDVHHGGGASFSSLYPAYLHRDSTSLGHSSANSHYSDYGNNQPSKEISSETSASQQSIEFFKFNGAFPEYKGEKNDIDDFTLESFELDPEVMKPPPPFEEDDTGEEGDEEHDRNERKKEEHRGDHEHSADREDLSDISNSTENQQNESTAPPSHTSQLEYPVTQQPIPLTRTPAQMSVYPVMRRPMSYRNAAPSLQLIAKPMYADKWRTILSQRELSALQMMKPPPLAHSSWRKKVKLRSRPTIIYL